MNCQMSSRSEAAFNLCNLKLKREGGAHADRTEMGRMGSSSFSRLRGRAEARAAGFGLSDTRSMCTQRVNIGYVKVYFFVEARTGVVREDATGGVTERLSMPESNEDW